MAPTSLSTGTRAVAAQTAQVMLKLISFQLCSPQDPSRTLNFAVGIDQMQRILNNTVSVGSGMNPVGLVAEQDITMIDLHQLIFGQPLMTSSYLVVVNSPTQGLLGIPVTQSPSLVDIAQDQLKPLPATYRAMDTLGIASHVGQAQTDTGLQTIFLLDLDRLVSHLTQR
jgi:hypothetical protein